MTSAHRVAGPKGSRPYPGTGARARARALERLVGLVAVSVVTSVSSSSAFAQEKHVSASLAWARADGAESCIAAPELARAIESRLGYSVFGSPASADVTVEGSVAPLGKGAGFRASFRVLDAKGEVLGSRQVETHEASCRSMDERAALVGSILVDDVEQAKKRAEPPLPAPTTSTTTAPSTPPPVPPPPPAAPKENPSEPAPAPSSAWRFSADAGLGLAVGLEPAPALGFAAMLTLRPPRFGAFFLGAGLFPSTSTSTGRGGSAQLQADAQFGTVGFCPLVEEGRRLEGLVCGGVLLGGLRAQGSGFDDSYGDRAVLVSALLVARGAVRLVGPLALTLGVGATFGLVRAEVTYREPDGVREAFTSAPVGFLGDVGLGLRFP